MNTYVILLRGINVGGKNKIAMAALKSVLETAGFSDVSTYIASGNVILKSDQPPDTIRARIEKTLPENFKLDAEIIRVLVLTRQQLEVIVDKKPTGFGEEPDKYHSDAIFLMDIDAEQVISSFNPREGVDTVWTGEGVVYSQRLSSERTKSRLNKIMASRHYKSMTIRNWNTTTTLFELLKKMDHRD